LLTDPDTAPTRGVELALNELADVAEEEWIQLVWRRSHLYPHEASMLLQRACTPLTRLATVADYWPPRAV